MYRMNKQQQVERLWNFQDALESYLIDNDIPIHVQDRQTAVAMINTLHVIYKDYMPTVPISVTVRETMRGKRAHYRRRWEYTRDNITKQYIALQKPINIVSIYHEIAHAVQFTKYGVPVGSGHEQDFYLCMFDILRVCEPALRGTTLFELGFHNGIQLTSDTILFQPEMNNIRHGSFSKKFSGE